MLFIETNSYCLRTAAVARTIEATNWVREATFQNRDAANHADHSINNGLQNMIRANDQPPQHVIK